MKIAALTSGAVFLASIPAALGHGNIVDPAAVWTMGYASNGYTATVPGTIWGTVDNSKYGYGGTGNIAYFKANYPTSDYKSLKALILAKQEMYEATIDPTCGYTILDESKRATMPSGSITFSGFTHPGPCELWCDDNVLAFDYDCQTTYADGKVPYDSALCDGANQFAIYWLAMHSDPWQVYPDCVYLEGGSGSAPSATTAPSTDSSSNSTTPAATTAAPATTTAAPATTTTAAPATTTAPAADDEYDDESAAGESTPAPSTNCQRRMRK